MTGRRLIEETFPLKQVSADSRHEKNVRHGHISTLHIWPARRPLAACRAAIIAALLPDPGNEAGRHSLNKKIESITHWGTENGPALDFFRQEIRQAFGGRVPRVLDMFAGGGAIPLEAMRLGCEVIANDYNPVAWFILKCTLEFPQRLAGKKWPLPATNSTNDTKKEPEHQLPLIRENSREFVAEEGDLAAHVRYWGNWVLERARAELAPYYPTVNGQPTVAYLWARTVPCPDPACGAEVPLLKMLWLSQKTETMLPDTPENRARPDFLRVKKTENTSRVVINGRRALRLVPNAEAHCVDFEIWVPDPKDTVPEGTMAGAKSHCPVCGVNLTSDYIKACGHSGKMGTRMTAVVVETEHGKEFRLPMADEEAAALRTVDVLSTAAAKIPYGLPTETLPESGSSGAGRAFTIPQYGFKTWADLFTPRQLLALVTFVKWTRAARNEMCHWAYPDDWTEAIVGYLGVLVNRLANYSSSICIWETLAGEVKQTFLRFALPITWDFAESNPILGMNRYYQGALDSVDRVLSHLLKAMPGNLRPSIINTSATNSTQSPASFDAILTDPPYYDAIPYADLADFFYVWLRRTIGDQYPNVFGTSLASKHEELVQQHKNGSHDRKGKEEYEAGMAIAFRNAGQALKTDGRMVVVFAHKDPEAWQTLVAAMIRAGLVVTASWPIDTEQSGGVRTHNRASLASSIWLVCRKRPADAGAGRYSVVRRAMQDRIIERLRYFWDIGISGPDFVWAAVGPALESYSAWDEVRRLDGAPFTVGEFLREVRRMVADFALGQILHGRSTEGLDEWTRYYLIHRKDYGLEDAPVGECILFAQGYGLDLNDVRGPRGLLVKGGGSDVRLAKWDERTRDDLGHPRPDGGLPLVDMLHRLVWLWSSGDTGKLRAYAEDRGLAQNDLFWEISQAVLEMAPAKSRERTLLEAVVAWGRGRTAEPVAFQPTLLEKGK
jgi:adenine-specific DNA methylase